MAGSWTTALVLVLCAMASTQAEKMTDKDMTETILDIVQPFAQVVTSEAVSLSEVVFEAVSKGKGGGLIPCASDYSEEFMAMIARALNVIYKAEQLYKDVVQFNTCTGNIITANTCRIGKINDFLSDLGGLKPESQDVLSRLKKVFKNYKDCVKNGRPGEESGLIQPIAFNVLFPKKVVAH